jgi:nitric oxide reductase subunit C
MPNLTKRAIVLSLLVAFMGYSMYVYTAGTSLPQAVSLDARVTAGQQVFQEYNCTACHQIYGLGGYMGPDLTNVISAPGKGPLYAQVFIRNGTARMPDFHLTEEQVDAVTAFLAYVDASGKYPADKYRIRWYGTVETTNE